MYREDAGMDMDIHGLTRTNTDGHGPTRTFELAPRSVTVNKSPSPSVYGLLF